MSTQRQFVVKLPDGSNRLVVVPSTGKVSSIRSVAGLSVTAGAFSFEGQFVDDDVPVLRFPELGTFNLIPPPSVAPRGASVRPMQGTGTECTICLEPIDTPSVISVALPCSHRFHAVCVREWSLHSAFCPLCRRTMHTAPPPVVESATPCSKKAPLPPTPNNVSPPPS
jgi:hypothetical protein